MREAGDLDYNQVESEIGALVKGRKESEPSWALIGQLWEKREAERTLEARFKE